jgi:L-lactate dehydrogenase (cytochrome)
MKEEVITGMRLLGVTSIEQLGPHLIRYAGRDPEPRYPAKL